MEPKCLTPTAAVGAISPEVVEAVFRYSEEKGVPLDLICSKNQIDYDGGYTGWTTASYMEEVRRLREIYPAACVRVCRDHCGPGFGPQPGLADVYETIQADLQHGFDLIHIDFCRYAGPPHALVQAACKAIDYCHALSPTVLIEVGTDENSDSSWLAIDQIGSTSERFLQNGPVEYYVVRTGSLVMEGRQVGVFHKEQVQAAYDLLASKGIRLKEHNADYLDSEALRSRRGIIDTMNIAPQCGSLQTSFILHQCLLHGIDAEPFIRQVDEGLNWVKWDQGRLAGQRRRCAEVAGHYHYQDSEYRSMIRQLSEQMDLRETLIQEHLRLLAHYHKETEA